MIRLGTSSLVSSTRGQFTVTDELSTLASMLPVPAPPAPLMICRPNFMRLTGILVPSLFINVVQQVGKTSVTYRTHLRRLCPSVVD